eukprot:TRINITY_DN1002_c0_g1_i1.p1 TRINITY_DN1002_c0_g1~~TRINITY_DN1002_c0_g1_i1.p1  ORF type:complete len:688 (+),score=239.82 TRINITY_DN1002_c0_g1_i1:42-2066(+)
MASAEALFKELDEIIRSSDVNYEEAIKVTDRILKDQPKDKDAVHVKAICLIQLNKFNDALALIEQAGLSGDLGFERAYCLYKDRKHKEALECLAKIPDPKPAGVLQLIAQAHYRLENWTSCISTYEELLKQVPTTELKTNVSAALSSAGKAAEGLNQVAQNQSVFKESFEYAYNAACLALVDSDYGKALQYLQQAIDTCKANSQAEGLSQQEVDDELAIVRTQLAFVKQKMKQDVEALEIYKQVLEIKPSDVAVVAVASNNIVTLQKDPSFDSDKKLKHASDKEADAKLAEWQKRTIAYNRCLLDFKLKKKDFQKTVEAFETRYPESSYPILLSVSALLREKKTAEAQAELEKHLETHKNLHAQLCVAQLRLIGGNTEGAIKMLESIDFLKNKPSMVATLVTLNEQKGNIAAASAVFDAAIKHWDPKKSPNSSKAESIYLALAQEAANFKLKHKMYKDAAILYQKLVEQFPQNKNLLGSYIVALAYSDPIEAEKVIIKNALGKSSTVDAEALENLPTYSRKIESAQPAAATPQTAEQKTTPTGPAVVKKNKDKKKKKKKKKLPKNYDPNVKPDPERWLPRHERSYYKRRPRRRGEQERYRGSAQGMVDKNSIPQIAEVLKPQAKGAAAGAKPAAPKQEPAKAAPPKQEPAKASPPTLKAPPPKTQSKKKGGRRR